MKGRTRNIIWVFFVIFLVAISLIASLVSIKKENNEPSVSKKTVMPTPTRPTPTPTKTNGTTTTLDPFPTMTETTLPTSTSLPSLVPFPSSLRSFSESNSRLVCSLYGSSLADITTEDVYTIDRSTFFWIQSYNGDSYGTSCLLLFNWTIVVGSDCKESHVGLCNYF